MEMKGLMGGFYRISEWIMRLSVINLLWIVCSVPFFLVLILEFAMWTQLKPEELVAAITPTTSIVSWFIMMLPVYVTAIFTLFPATAAMFTVARKWITGEEDVSLFKTFFRGYKENYKQSMIGGIFFVVLFSVLWVNFSFYREMTGMMQMLAYMFIAFFIILFVAFFHYFSIMVHFHMKTFQVFKNALLITIGRPIRTFIILLLNCAVIYLSFAQFTFLIPFFMGSIIAFLSFHQFYQIFRKTQDQLEREKQQEAERLEEEERERHAAESDAGEHAATAETK